MPYVVFKGAHGGRRGQAKDDRSTSTLGLKRLGTVPTHIVPEPGGQDPCPEGPGRDRGAPYDPGLLMYTSSGRGLKNAIFSRCAGI